MVVHENFAIKLPVLSPRLTPLLAAGAIYEPLKNLESNSVVAVIGLGGKGALAIKIAKALGHQVLAVSSKRSKEPAARNMGADLFMVSSE